MNELYIRCLYKQFCMAYGLDINDTSYIDSKYFMYFILSNYSILKEFREFLMNYGVYNPEDSIEIGKGRFDSLNGIDDIKTISIFNYNNPSTLLIEGSTPYVLKRNGSLLIPEHRIITHNPYQELEVASWNELHNSGSKDITIGVFGRISDDDESKKVGFIERLSRKLNDDYSLEYDTKDGNYFCSINSNRKKLQKVKVKTR